MPIAMQATDNQMVLKRPERIVGQKRYSRVVDQSILPRAKASTSSASRRKVMATAVIRP
jgi:hypothetical protein